MSSTGTQDTSYSPTMSNDLDYKSPSLGDELHDNWPKTPSVQRGVPGLPFFARKPKPLPKLPTIQGMAAEQQFQLANPPPAQTKPGLFETYLSKDPGHIIQSARTEPQRYDAQAVSLLEDLYEGRKKWEALTPAERQNIDEAALEFFSPTPKIPGRSSLAPTSPTVQTQGWELPKPKPVEGPVLDAFWWAK